MFVDGFNYVLICVNWYCLKLIVFKIWWLFCEIMRYNVVFVIVVIMVNVGVNNCYEILEIKIMFLRIVKNISIVLKLFCNFKRIVIGIMYVINFLMSC